MEPPPTLYASTEDGQIAYQVLGEGKRDLLYLRGVSNVEAQWDVPSFAAFLERLSSFGRLIVFDRRGSGASDALTAEATWTWEEWVDDALAVLDAVGSTSAVVLGEIEGGPVALALGASHPERVESLVLMNTSAKYLVGDDYPIGVSEETVVGFVDLIRQTWGTEDLVKLALPASAGDPEMVRAMARFVRLTATPRTAAAQYDYMFRSSDTRSVLAAIQAPTLVLHRTDTPFVPLSLGKYLAEHIQDARLVEIPGQDLYFFGDQADAALDEIAEFVTGEAPSHDPARILATVLFTDIVASTEQASSRGDHDWSLVLDAHHAIVRRELSRHRGREVGTAGDGFLATFDGPTPGDSLCVRHQGWPASPRLRRPRRRPHGRDRDPRRRRGRYRGAHRRPGGGDRGPRRGPRFPDRGGPGSGIRDRIRVSRRALLERCSRILGALRRHRVLTRRWHRLARRARRELCIADG